MRDSKPKYRREADVLNFAHAAFGKLSHSVIVRILLMRLIQWVFENCCNAVWSGCGILEEIHSLRFPDSAASCLHMNTEVNISGAFF